MGNPLLDLQPHKVSRDLRGYSVMFYGKPKTGKTTTASKFPGAILAAFERGYNALTDVFVWPLKSWPEFRKFIKYLEDETVQEKFQTIVIDTADIAYDLCVKYICSRESTAEVTYETIGDIPYGKGYGLIEKEFDILQKNSSNTKAYNRHPPYKIYLKNKLSNSNTGEYVFSEGSKDYFELLSQFRITSDNHYVDSMLEELLDEENHIYLMVKLNIKSKFVKKELSFDNCLVEKCSPIKEEDEDISYAREMEIEEEDEYIKNITLDHCFQYFTDEECLDEGNEWFCNKCRRRVTASKQIELFYLPRIMCICLTRFLKKGRFYDYTKNDTFVEFPLNNLNMEKYTCCPDRKFFKYDLFAVSQHYGGMGGGHYTAVCKNIDGNWYEYDDKYYTPILS